MTTSEVAPFIDVFSEEIYFVVRIGNFDVGGFRCVDMANHLARRLAEARDRPHRESIHFMMQELGMCETFAKNVYSAFFGEASSTRH